MNEMVEKEKINIEDMIYEIRGKQVMLASDVAKLYQTETKIINQVVKRNLNRFPSDFCFQLTDIEFVFLKEQKSLRSQFVTLNKSNDARGLHIKYLPYVFTEHGIMMLSGLLKSELAAQVNVLIIKAFIEIRNYIGNNLIEQRHINNQVLKNTEDIKLLQESFDKLNNHSIKNGLFFEGQVYDAYSLLLDIFESSKDSIIIIDNYADKKLLDLLSKTEKEIKVYSKNMDEELIKKYKSQYNNVEIIKNDTFHDRFIIIDNKDLYHSGASFKELGKKCFAVNKVKDEKWLSKIMEYLK